MCGRSFFGDFSTVSCHSAISELQTLFLKYVKTENTIITTIKIATPIVYSFLCPNLFNSKYIPVVRAIKNPALGR